MGYSRCTHSLTDGNINHARRSFPLLLSSIIVAIVIVVVVIVRWEIIFSKNGIDPIITNIVPKSSGSIVIMLIVDGILVQVVIVIKRVAVAVAVAIPFL